MARFEFVDEQPESNIQPSQTSGSKKPRFQYVDQQEKPPESNLKTAARLGVQTISKPVQEIVSIPGNLMRFIADYGTTAAEKISGRDLSGFRKGLEDTAPFKVLPSSEQSGKTISKLTGGLSEPQSAAEQTYGDVLGLGTLLVTGAQNPAKWQTLAKETARAIGVVGAGKAAESLGAGETGKAATELGTLAISSLYRPGAIQEYLGKQFQSLRQSPVAKRIVPTTDLESSLKQLNQQWSRGGTTPASRAASGKLKELEGIASKGNAEVDELLESYRKVNAEIQDRNLFDSLDKGGKIQLRKHFDELKNAIGKNIEQTTPKDFYDNWRSINQGYSTFAQSRRISDWIAKNKSTIAKAALPSAIADIYLSIGAIGPVAAGAAAGMTAKALGETMYRISNSPQLRKYYMESLKHITQENGPAAIKSMKKLGMAMENDKD